MEQGMEEQYAGRTWKGARAAWRRVSCGIRCRGDFSSGPLVPSAGVFDFRYHVASLAAVFLALVIGILVGVGISGRGLVDKSERRQFEKQIEILQSALDSSQTHAAQLDRQQQATSTFVQQAYPALMAARLSGKHYAVLVVGREDGATGSSVQRALHDAGAVDVVRYRALKVPIDPAALRGPLSARKQLAVYAGAQKVGDLGQALARELVHGGKTPLWDALSSQIVEELRGPTAAPVDGAIVIRAVPPQSGPTARLLDGLYTGLASAGVPVVGVEAQNSVPTAVGAFTRAGLSTVDNVDTPLGRLALVLLLEGADPGSYGLGKVKAPNGLLPPIPLTPVAG
jgi:hypothetical protein